MRSTSESPEGAKSKSPGQRPGASGATDSSPVGAKPIGYRPYRDQTDAGLTFPGQGPGLSNGAPSGLFSFFRRTHVKIAWRRTSSRPIAIISEVIEAFQSRFFHIRKR